MSRDHRYAQHFLRSPRLVAELIGHSNIRKNDTVYDLGAGSGVISSVLMRRAKEVVAVEIEPRALAKLRENLGSVKNVTIVQKDILKLTMPNKPYKIFANIPFDISAAAIRHFTQNTHPPKAMYLITQQQFAHKLVPGDDHFTSQLSAEISPWFTARIRKPLRRTDFTPPPGVDTVLLEVKQQPTPLLNPRRAGEYRQFIERCFSRQKYFTSLPREQAGISAELRPSQLTPEQWITLFEQKTPL